jgi:hypothetical protein
MGPHHKSPKYSAFISLILYSQIGREDVLLLLLIIREMRGSFVGGQWIREALLRKVLLVVLIQLHMVTVFCDQHFQEMILRFSESDIQLLCHQEVLGLWELDFL